MKLGTYRVHSNDERLKPPEPLAGAGAATGRAFRPEGDGGSAPGFFRGELSLELLKRWTDFCGMAVWDAGGLPVQPTGRT